MYYIYSPYGLTILNRVSKIENNHRFREGLNGWCQPTRSIHSFEGIGDRQVGQTQ